MSFTNHMTSEVQVKLVYAGPAFGGKTTSVSYVESFDPEVRGKRQYNDERAARVLTYSFLPKSAPRVQGMSLRLELATVPGAVDADDLWRFVLEGVDAVVFVADSQSARADANVEAMASLSARLTALGREPARVPTVLAYNKRDLPEIATVDAMNARLNPRSLPFFETTATQGDGVLAALKEATKLALALLTLAALGCSPAPPTRAPASTVVVADAAPPPPAPDAAMRREWDARDHEARGLVGRRDFGGAEALALRNLELADLSFGAEDADTLTSVELLAGIYGLERKIALAQPLLERALAATEKRLGSEDPSVAEALRRLANVCLAQEQTDRAEALDRRALAIAEKTQGPTHPDTANVLTDLGRVAQVKKDFETAISLYRRAIEILERHPDDPNLLKAHLLLGRLHRERGQPAKAEAHLAFAVGMMEKTLGPDDPAIVPFLTELAACYEAERKPALALPLKQRAERIAQKPH
jgi:tetratricopeptide (TPR) repeat protein